MIAIHTALIRAALLAVACVAFLGSCAMMETRRDCQSWDVEDVRTSYCTRYNQTCTTTSQFKTCRDSTCASYSTRTEKQKVCKKWVCKPGYHEERNAVGGIMCKTAEEMAEADKGKLGK